MTSGLMYARLKDYFRYHGDYLSAEVLDNVSTLNLWRSQRHSYTCEHFMRRIMQELVNDEVVIYGAGGYGELIFELFRLRGVKVIAFMDTYKTGKFLDIPIISVGDYCKHHKGTKIAVSNILASWAVPQEIRENLQENGVKIEDIYFVSDDFRDFPRRTEMDRLCERSGSPRYFAPPELRHSSNEFYVDIGSYDGSSVNDFLDWCKGDYSAIHSFDIVDEYCEKQRKMFADKPNIYVKNCGISNVNTTMNVTHAAAGSSITQSINESIKQQINVFTIDSLFENDSVTFFKIYTAGLELEALQGASNTIKRCYPQICVNIFEHPDLWWKVPDFIWRISKNYRLMFRQWYYTTTCLVAIPE